jgi:tRNA threonylcarbamoyl adenosine modification protein YeaZ
MRSPDEPILYVDTASDTLMLGLSRNGAMVGRYGQPCDSHRYHSALMTPAIHALLEENGLAPRDLAAVAVNRGPGSFTGVRTGLITARTLGQFLPVSLYAFNTFELLAWQFAPETGPVAIHLDARRGKSFHAVLRYGPDGPVVLREPALVSLSGNSSRRTEMLPDDEEPGGLLLASESLLALLATDSSSDPDSARPSQPAHFLDKHPYTPDIMMALVERYGPAFRTPWRDMSPLYLQEPSVTLRTSRPKPVP